MSLNTLRDLSLVDGALRGVGFQPPYDYMELLWDNFCSLDPGALAEHLNPWASSLGLHVMWSRFLERDDEAIDALLRRLKQFIVALKPITVSDHVCRFTVGGVRVHFAQEYDYLDLDRVISRVGRYQDTIGMQILLENTASTHYHAEDQISFFEKVCSRTGAGNLFDISNAVAGEANGLGDASLWIEHLSGRTVRGHIGGYGLQAASGLMQDTHAHDISPESHRTLRHALNRLNITSLTYERDYRVSPAACTADLQGILECMRRL